MDVISWEPIPASDASTLAYLAEFPDVEAEDIGRLLAPLCPDSKEIAKALLAGAPLSAEAKQVAQTVLGDLSAVSEDAQRSAESLKQWAAKTSARR